MLFEKDSMNTKLTLTIEKEVIKIAKEYAKEKGLSLSEMGENYFKFVTVKRVKLQEKQPSSKVRKLRGIIKTENDLDYRQILTEELSKNMEYKLFLDSDVVIDFFTDREPHANPASELFELNE